VGRGEARFTTVPLDAAPESTYRQRGDDLLRRGTLDFDPPAASDLIRRVAEDPRSILLMVLIWAAAHVAGAGRQHG